MHQTRKHFTVANQAASSVRERRKVGMHPDEIAFRVVTFAPHQGQQCGGMRRDKTVNQECRLVRGQVERGALEQVLGRIRQPRMPERVNLGIRRTFPGSAAQAITSGQCLEQAVDRALETASRPRRQVRPSTLNSAAASGASPPPGR